MEVEGLFERSVLPHRWPSDVVYLLRYIDEGGVWLAVRLGGCENSGTRGMVECGLLLSARGSVEGGLLLLLLLRSLLPGLPTFSKSVAVTAAVVAVSVELSRATGPCVVWWASSVVVVRALLLLLLYNAELHRYSAFAGHGTMSVAPLRKRHDVEEGPVHEVAVLNLVA